MSNEPEYGKIKLQIVRDIADAIREKTRSSDDIAPSNMASKVRGIATADDALVLKDNEKILQFAEVADTIQAHSLINVTCESRTLS